MLAEKRKQVNGNMRKADISDVRMSQIYIIYNCSFAIIELGKNSKNK